MKKILMYVGKNLHVIFYGGFLAYIKIPILSWTAIIGLLLFVAATEVRDYLNGIKS